MAKSLFKIEAHKLRKRGLSIKSIASRLNVSKNSVSIWCKDIKLTKKQQEKLVQNSGKGRLMGAQINKKKKEQCIEFYRENGKKEIGKFSRRDFLIAGLALYWGEGSKTFKLSFSNSEPSMIKFMFLWFKKIMKIKNQEFMPRIFINAIHKPRIDKVIKFWSNFLKLPVEQFGNPVFLNINSKKVYENYNTYYGVMSLGIKRSTYLKYKILGLIEAMKVK